MKPKTNLSYTRLKQKIDSDDDDDYDNEGKLYDSDDEVLFDRESRHKLRMEGYESQTDNIEVDEQMREKPKYRVKIHSYQRRPHNLERKICIILSVTLVLIGGLMSIPVIHYTLQTGQILNISKDWTIVLNDTATESQVRLIDVDGDGKDDILIGVMVDTDAYQRNQSRKEYCKKIGVEEPCLGTLLALRGYDGKELWRVTLKSGVLLMNCHDIDVNMDGKMDCIVSGRGAMMAAVDITAGKVLWRLKLDEHFEPTWNIFQAVPLPDFTSDGVPEILIAHGGNPDADAEEHERANGRLILLSGSNGKPLGNTYSLPIYRETYMSPVLYTTPSGSIYILYGTGGETVKGDLLAISVPDFYRAVMGVSSTVPVPGLDIIKKYDEWPNKMRDPLGVITLIQGVSKGVMVPPVIVDVNNDGINDILASVFDGHLTLLDGKTLNTLWQVYLNNSESYSSPAPGYFDGDDILDFMFHYSHGVWDTYNYTTYVVISGKDGSVLWKMVADLFDMSSDLVVKTTQHCDLFILKVIGRNGSDYVIDEQTGNSIQREMSSNVRIKRHEHYEHEETEEDIKLTKEICKERKRLHDEDIQKCGERSVSKYTQEVFAIGQATQYRLIKILDSEAVQFYYDVKLKPGQVHCQTDDPTVDHVTSCTVLTPDGRLTSAIGDVDGNGRLDFITQIHTVGKIFSDSYEFQKLKYITTIKRIKLLESVRQGQTVKYPTYSQINLTHPVLDTEIKFLPKVDQKWLEYLGSGNYNIY